MDKKIYNGKILVDQWGNSHTFSVSRALNIPSVSSSGITMSNAFPNIDIPTPYFYIMPTEPVGTLKIKLLQSLPNEYILLNENVLDVNTGVFMPLKVVEIHKDSTNKNFIIGA